MPTMNVSLPEPLARFVEEQIESGTYSSASEVVRAGLRLLRERDAFEEAKLELLRAEVNKGLADAEAGRFATRSLEEIAAEVLREAKGNPE